MRTSSYVIHVDIPQQPDQVLVVQGYTGAYDVVSRPVAEYLRAHETERHTPVHGEWPAEPSAAPAPAPSDAAIALLQRRGYLTEATADEERERVRGLADRCHEGELQAKPNYVFMMSYDCNLRCAYCFQDHMRTDPAYSHLLRTMDRSVIDRTIRAMRQIDERHRGAQGRRRITLFGGEPLLAASRPVIEYLLAQLEREGGANIHAVTNATDLHHYFDLLGPHAIQSIQVTIDGPKDEHDQRRIRADQTGSFDAIVTNLGVAAQRDVSIAIRINVDKHNVERLPELGRVFRDHGLDRRGNVYAYAAVIHAANENVEKKDTFTQYALAKRIAELRAEHPEMACIHGPTEEVKGRLRRIMQNTLTPWQEFRATYCGAHSTMYVLDPFGDIYACWERTGEPEIRIGKIDAHGDVEMFRSAPEQVMAPVPATAPTGRRMLPVLTKPKIAGLEAWRGRTFSTNHTCLSCKYAFYCGGGCAAEAIDHKHEYYTNYCSGFQQKFRVAAAEAYLETRTGRPAAAEAVDACGH